VTRRLLAAGWLAAALAGCSPAVPEARAADDQLGYHLEFRVALGRGDPAARVTLKLTQSRRLLREVRFDFDPARYTDFRADAGELGVSEGVVRWLPAATGGTLSWSAGIPHERSAGGFDAWQADDWALFRAEDLVPRAATRTLKGATSNTKLVFDLPHGWSAVTPYREKDGSFTVDNPERRYDEPAGWIVAGEIGVRRDRIAGTRVAIAAPVGESVRRLDMLAMLNWTLPELARIVPTMPERLTIVSAGDPMWRGGLSGPASIYIHADRPLLSENGTSTLLHELMHVATGLDSVAEHDWIVEGLAEYYTLELLHRSGTLTASRHRRALEDIADWGQEAGSLCGHDSSAATTAYAVGVFDRLDRELRRTTGGRVSLDDVHMKLIESDSALSPAMLTTTAEELAGRKPEALNIAALEGCRNIIRPD